MKDNFYPNLLVSCLLFFFIFQQAGATGAESTPADNQPPANMIFNDSPLLESYSPGTGFAEFRLIDPDGDSGVFSLVSGDGDADNGSFRIQSGTFLVVNRALDFETQPTMNIRVRGTDPGGLFTERSYTLNVVDENEAPEFTSTAVVVAQVNVEYSYTATVQDPDQGDSVSNVEVTLAPNWLTFTVITQGQTYRLSGTPTGSDSGIHEVRIKATDQSGTGRVQRFFITVQEEGSVVNFDHFIYLPLVVKN